MTKKICPYPGLRPFTVEESVFFKGRDLHIRQIISKLEEKKVLILTGASGDGKSSLVYAGVIPNAKAGFFRAKHNNWLFATFRPERKPFNNLAQSIAESLHIDADYCETELKYGFSSLVDLYKASPYYVDEDSEQWSKKSETEKKQAKLKASNLFILADQFEEFFTNSENFSNGKPSNDAYTAVNLLLETAKIALRDNLPIYIICTMRSDFISQSVAFRGLPETIGFSQFFVPRLNRRELQQVIEEPAILSGGKFTKRLKEILINELNDGFDQLPLLQHTLKQLWENAKNGDEEIDLIHLAKLGGIHQKYLPDTDNTNFEKWKLSADSISEKYLQNPSASNVLNAHANFLYENAYDFFKKNTEWADKNISEEDAKYIIKTTLQSLVKIDEGRAVRSRMTLRELTNIVNKPHVSYETICGVLNIFRTQDNTFLYPFIDNDDIETQYLSADSVLDITHEALIRNWEYLKNWNIEEHENLTNFHDFNVQLQRWLHNNKSKDFLLAIGQLSHFEEWYEKSQLNKYWLAKYDESSLNYDEKLANAEDLVFNASEFITKSRETVTRREKARRRRKNIAILALAIVTVSLSALTYWAMNETKNAQKQKQIAEQQTDSARLQQTIAVKANLKADSLRLISEKNAETALFEKAKSDSAFLFADNMRRVAEDKTKLAETETEKVRLEKKKSDSLRLLAKSETQKAVLASDSAKALSYLAISQSLSFKASQKFDDKQVNLLLAMQAYKFNKKYFGYKRDAVLFNAMRHAQSIAGYENAVSLRANQISGINQFGKVVYAVSRNGKFIIYDNDTKEIVSEIKIFTQGIPVNSSYVLSQDIALISLENRKLLLYNIKTEKTIELLGHSDFVRTAKQIKNTLITGSRDKTIRIWNIKTGENTHTYTTKGRVNTLAVAKQGRLIYAGLSSGDIIKVEVGTNKIIKLNSRNNTVFEIQLFPKNSKLAVGYSDGKLRLIDLAKSNTYNDISVSVGGVRFIAIRADSKLLATYSDDKKIKIFDLENSDKNPNVIEDFNRKLSFFRFKQTKLVALTINNLLYEWETKPEQNATNINLMLKRNFTKDEWRKFIGEDIEYETTK